MAKAAPGGGRFRLERGEPLKRYITTCNNEKETMMPFLIPVLVGVPLLFGGGYVIYHLVH